MVRKVSMWLILEPLLFSESKHLSEISREVGKSHVIVKKYLDIFEKNGIIEKKKIGRQIFYKFRENPLIIDYFTIIEKERLIKRCNEDLVLKDIVEFFHSLDNPVIIFGSAVNSVNDAEDIDIIVVGNFDKKKIEVLEEKLNIKFHLISVKNLKEINKTLKEEIRKKHLIINGSERVIKWLIS